MIRTPFLLLLLASASSLSALNIFSEDFESATVGYYTNGNNVTGSIFRVIGNNAAVDIAGGVDYGWLCAAPGASGQCMDTTGGGGNGRGVVETVSNYAFAAGNYTLSIGITRWNDNPPATQDATIRVSIGSLFTATYVVDSSWINGIVIENFSVGALTNARLTIEDLSGSAAFAGAVIDNISVDEASPIPEPSTYALAAAGIIAFAFSRRRR